MAHSHRKHYREKEKRKARHRSHEHHVPDTAGKALRPSLEIVLKCDSAGCAEAVSSAIYGIVMPHMDINIIQSGIGAISKSDILMADTGSGLIIGFQVGVQRGLERELKEHGVEVRLYDVIYRLTADIRDVAESLVTDVAQEQIIGTARVIALFPSSKKGIIMGCEVLNGRLALGERFRLITAMGPVYSGTLGSIHIEKNAVQKVTKGQQCGVKITDFNRVKIGDLVESFHPLPVKKTFWRPQGQIIVK